MEPAKKANLRRTVRAGHAKRGPRINANPVIYSRFPRHLCFNTDRVVNGTESKCCSESSESVCFDMFWTKERCCPTAAERDVIRPEFKACADDLQRSLLSCIEDVSTLGGCMPSENGEPEHCPALLDEAVSARKVSGRDSMFARVLWCLSSLPSAKSVLDLFIAGGATAHIIGHAFTQLSSGIGKDWHIAGYELDRELAREAAKVMTHFSEVGYWQGTAVGDSAKTIVVAGLVPAEENDASTLRAICKEGADIVLLDPDFQVLMQAEFLLLEKVCRPRAYLINNINLPAHGGWMRETLMQYDGWAEILTGVAPDFMLRGLKDGARSIFALRAWTLLVRDHGEGRCLAQ